MFDRGLAFSYCYFHLTIKIHPYFFILLLLLVLLLSLLFSLFKFSVRDCRYIYIVE